MELNSEIDAFVDVEEDNLLHCMQHDLLNLQDRAIIGLTADELAYSGQKRRLDPQDRSVAIQVCHSAQREVEVLQDHLLALMEADPELKARDIIVMVADIDAYAPLFRPCLQTPRQNAICRLPFLTVVPVRRILLSLRFCNYCHCRTAGLSLKMCWRCWMSRP